MRRACIRCGRHSGCSCRSPVKWGERGTGAERTAQARFRTQVLERDGYQCRDCGSTQDLRACHIQPRHMDGSYDVTNGITRCADCDHATDPYAR